MRPLFCTLGARVAQRAVRVDRSALRKTKKRTLQNSGERPFRRITSLPRTSMRGRVFLIGRQKRHPAREIVLDHYGERRASKCSGISRSAVLFSHVSHTDFKLSFFRRLAYRLQLLAEVGARTLVSRPDPPPVRATRVIGRLATGRSCGVGFPL